jgi:uncharacterized protein YceK
MSRKSLAILVCAAFAFSGCSAIISRKLEAIGSSPPPPLYFGGVRSDYEISLGPSRGDNPWFCPVYSVIDFPFSLGADVLFLPYDCYTDYHYTNNTTMKLP